MGTGFNNTLHTGLDIAFFLLTHGNDNVLAGKSAFNKDGAPVGGFADALSRGIDSADVNLFHILPPVL